jgi:hypothetical protein
MEHLHFEVALFETSYHAILGRPALARFMAVEGSRRAEGRQRKKKREGGGDLRDSFAKIESPRTSL